MNQDDPRNRWNGGYSEDPDNGYTGGYEDQYPDDSGYYDGYYDDGSYDSSGDGYYEDGGYDDGSYYDDGNDPYGYQEDYYEPTWSMASQASGKANPDPYGRRTAPRRPQPVYQYEYEYESQPKPKKRRRKRKHHGRNFLLFLLILIGILVGLYFLLFRAPEQSQDGIHTRKEGFFNILICATDEEEMRTDTMIMATLDEKEGTVSITSLPRDTIISNGEAVPKLNGVYGLAGGGEAGAEALMNEVQKLLGFRPDGYAIVNYQIFKDVVDAMGGVTFDVPMDMVVDNANDPNDVMEIYAGEQLLDGTQALGVCRYRVGYAMADIQRQYVQQSFLKAMIKQCMSPSKLLKLPKVYAAAMDNTLTNLSGANVRYLALKVLLAGMGDMAQNTLPGEGVTYNGASCYGLYGQSVVDLVNQIMNPYEEWLSMDDVYILTVSGGYLVESTWRGEAFDASSYVYQ